MNLLLFLYIVGFLKFIYANPQNSTQSKRSFQPGSSFIYFVNHPAVPLNENLTLSRPSHNIDWFHKSQPNVAVKSDRYGSFNRPLGHHHHHLPDNFPNFAQQNNAINDNELYPNNIELGLLETWDKPSIMPYMQKYKGSKNYKRRYSTISKGPSGSIVYGIVLNPGDEIVSALRFLAKQHNLKAVYIVTCIAGINEITLRYALDPRTNTRRMETIQKELEIVSLTGTVAADGSGFHLHASLYDEKGNVIGGHVAGDIVVSVTAEIVVGEALDYVFTRQVRPSDGLNELQISRRHRPDWPFV